MRLMLWARWLLVMLASAWPAIGWAAPKRCVTAEQASALVNKDVCVTAHVYDVVVLADGTRFLDVCPPETADDDCRFTLVSRWDDRQEVGELRKYRDMDVEIRGVVRTIHGRAGIELSHARQFRGGPPKFRPNPRLAHGFDAGQDRPPIHDPNLRSQGRGRSFMNSREQETRVVK